MKFEWDPQKNKMNLKKHGISFEDAVFVFSDKNALSIYDDEHSEKEDRWITLGMIPLSKLIIVIHTDRLYDEDEYIRIISARKATLQESVQYKNSSEGELL